MTAVELFVESLRKRGVAWIATLCGHGLDPFLHAAQQAAIRLVDVRNEQTAAYMADAWGKLTRRPGVCAVSSGVAHANALTGVMNAWFDRSPMLLITGAGALGTAGMGHFQDIDQVAVARPITKYARVVDRPERAVQFLEEAWDSATAWPPGPVHLTFPLDVQTAPAGRQLRFTSPARVCGAADPNLNEALMAAERPLLVAGSGVFYSGGGAALMAFAARLSIPVVVPIWDRGVVESPLENYLGVIGAATGGPRLLPDADLVIMAGAEPDYRVGFLEPPAVAETARVVRLDGDWQRLQAVERRPFTEWLAEARRRLAEFRASVERTAAEQARRGTHAIHILAALREVLPEDAVLLIDGGSIGQWAHQWLLDHYAPAYLTCGRSAVVGWGIGGAMAARLAFPDRPVVLLSGDGAFTFNVAELESASRQKLPFVAVVADDQGWGITRVGHIQQFGAPVASALGPIAFDRLAESLGARGIRAGTPEEIAPALRDALGRSEVSVIHVPVVGGNPG